MRIHKLRAKLRKKIDIRKQKYIFVDFLCRDWETERKSREIVFSRVVVRVWRAKTGIKGIYLRSKRMKVFYRGVVEKERKIKKNEKIFAHIGDFL